MYFILDHGKRNGTHHLLRVPGAQSQNNAMQNEY